MKLKLYLINAQDLYIFLDHYKNEEIQTMREHTWQLMTTSFKANKDLNKTLKLSQDILTHDPDIISMVEVGGSESLENFNTYFLNDKYEILYLPSNSDRGIDMGYLCKRNIGINFKVKSHNKRVLKNGKRFARGVLELRVIKEKRVEFFFLLTHLKSKLDMRNEDFEGRSQRDAEACELLEIYKQIEKDYPEVPIAIHGDLNSIIYKDKTEAELQIFDDNEILDLLELNQAPPQDRTTYYYFDKGHKCNSMQLDYILTHKRFKSAFNLDSTFIGKFDETLYQYPPKTLKERYKYPSDHLPYITEIII